MTAHRARQHARCHTTPMDPAQETTSN
jgi:hypothetical protein